MSKGRGIHNRLEYTKGSLDEKECPANPMPLLEKWFQLASGFGRDELPMVLSTVGNDLRPSSRVVLLKGFDSKGLYFFSNFQSRKGQELELNPFAAINFFWKELERQLRLEGRVEKLPADDSDRYFNSRPLESRISATISPQSKIIPDRNYLVGRHDELMQKSGTGKYELLRPDYWGGYIFYPDVIEFWQGRPGRLHDRIRYSQGEGTWSMVRLGS